MKIIVDCQESEIRFQGQTYPCRVGRKGWASPEAAHEGDEKTPLGSYHIRFGFYRSDRLSGPPPSSLVFWPIAPDDGWCDDPEHPAYNRFIRRPLAASSEALWRKDHVYDIILVLDYNDSPAVKGKGSAIFIHICREDDKRTLGCIALTPEVMIKLVRSIEPGSVIQII